ncbi:hypothetical protein [Streptomyces griseoaurantiacus]
MNPPERPFTSAVAIECVIDGRPHDPFAQVLELQAEGSMRVTLA